MDLLPETEQADNSFGPLLVDGDDATARLVRLGDEVVALVPDCVAMSLSLVDLGVTFTVASSSRRASMLDAVQYADDGPCLRAMRDGVVLPWRVEDLEDQWHAFALASAAAGIASSLSLPIMRGDTVIGGFNLYASTPHAFDAHHEALASTLGAWAGGATTNADLGFTTRDLARRAPQVLRDEVQLTVAASALARVVGGDQESAVERLRRAATQSAVPLETLVEEIVRSLDDQG